MMKFTPNTPESDLRFVKPIHHTFGKYINP